jgi:peptidoglycan/LPS O-acetylase OafA/YrhL
VAWRGVAWRGVAWRGVAWRGVAWRGVAWRGVAWTMLIEILFYAAMFATLPLVKSRPVAASPIILVTVVIVICSAREFGAGYFHFASSVSYLQFLLVGQLIYLRWVRSITVLQTAVLAALTYGVAVLAIDKVNRAFLPANNSYMISAGFAVWLFLAALSFEGSFHRIAITAGGAMDDCQCTGEAADTLGTKSDGLNVSPR